MCRENALYTQKAFDCCCVEYIFTEIDKMKSLFLVILLLALTVGGQGLATPTFCSNDKIRAKYCRSADPADIERCLSCNLGPSCPIPGQRGPVNEDEGLILLRGISDRKIQKLIVAMLNKNRLKENWSRCVPLFSWDTNLASAAQAWADQCALVEYPGLNYTETPEKLYHDSWHQRSAVLNVDQMHNGPGVAQSVHWARTGDFDLNGQILEALMDSDLSIEDGLIDGLMTNLPYTDSDIVAFGQATHVGCGWIQFPLSRKSQSDDQIQYENFMVCNYGVGLASKTTCDNVEKAEENEANETAVKYFTVTSDVIKDVKACLAAVRCKRRRRKLFKTFTANEMPMENDPCSQDVKTCLSGKSGLKFVDATRLKSVARSNELRPIDVEASKCKIDTILCSLNSTRVCKERLEYCLPLIDIEATEKDGNAVLCECANLVLADGTRGDCSATVLDPEIGLERPFCFVKVAPCVSIDPSGGQLELSRPYQEADGLLHYTHTIC